MQSVKLLADTSIVTRGDQDLFHFLFLVIPPRAGIGPTYDAMVMAVQDDDVSAERILAATGIAGADRSDVPQSSPG
ncbi:hypothetical protein [Streptomyces griseorubiginosus]|uniref:hypothetical protein n=1 Tax=Streptomyces griseorubiginosus TaxID=67304 RepID=UPI0036E4393D